MKKRWKIAIGALLTLAVLGGAGFTYWKRPQAPEFEKVEVTRDALEVKVTASGGVQPQNRLEIKPPVAGRIERILYREGDVVRKGATLAWMSSSERVALVDIARSKGKEEVKRWEEMYRETPIVAPMTGILISRKVEPGQTLGATDVALTMSNKLIVRADVDETDIAKIKVGQKATMTLDAYPRDHIEAVVDQIAFDAKTANNVTVYSVDLVPATIPDFMRSGMSANVDFIIERKEEILTLRADAIRGRGRESSVLIATNDPQNPTEKVAIKTGISDGKVTEVVSGLEEGAVVLVPKVKLFGADSAVSSNPFMPMGGRRGGGGHGGGGGGRPR